MKIYGDMHTHTIASTHAYSTILENCQWAEKYGLKGIAMTDHAMKMADAPHIWHFENLCVLPRKISNVTVLKGIEADIMNDDGELDVSENLMNGLEWIVVSMHSYCYKPTTVEGHTNAYLKICRIPQIDVIGHCTTSTFPFDYEKGVKAFKEYGKIVEINESSMVCHRSPKKNVIELVKLCKKYEVPVVIDSDSHYCEKIGQVSNTLQIAEELDLPEKLIVNSDWEKVREYVLKKRPELDI